MPFETKWRGNALEKKYVREYFNLVNRKYGTS
jgi:hypothetical protein